jgi:hypothetical protein
MVGELTRKASDTMKLIKPDALFVFKGNYVSPTILLEARQLGVTSVNYYPDVSFFTHGPQLPRALREYDHIFTAKTFGIADMKAHGFRSRSAPSYRADPG